MTDLPNGIEKLFCAVLSDALDAAGEMHQAFPHTIRPLDSELVMVGRARTAIYREVVDVPEGHNPYALEIELVDSLQPGEIAIMACGGSSRIAPWGGLLSTAAKARGAAGCVTDGLIRDTKRIREMAFPVFHGGIGPLDSRGRSRMMEMDCRIVCGGVELRTNDWIFGDADGVVVIPQEIADQVFTVAEEKVTAEDRSREDLIAGRLLRDVYEAYGVL